MVNNEKSDGPGGGGLPGFNLYYVAAQQSHFYHLNKTDLLEVPNHNVRTILPPAYSQWVCWRLVPLIVFYFIITFGKLALTRLGNLLFQSHIPLWYNHHLPELLLDPILWACYGVAVHFTQVFSMQARFFHLIWSCPIVQTLWIQKNSSSCMTIWALPCL